MTARTLIVVHRTGDQILVMLPFESDTDARHYAIVNEDEGLCIASAMRRMAVTRDDSAVEVGEPGDKLRIEHLDHGIYPFEMVFEHADGTIVVDLRRDEALTVADMLWGASRGPSFYMSATITGMPRKREPMPGSVAWALTPARQDAVARMLGDAQRRVRGETPKTKG